MTESIYDSPGSIDAVEGQTYRIAASCACPMPDDTPFTLQLERNPAGTVR